MSLRGKVALVTGGSRGIGRDVAEALARAGMNLALAARAQSELNEARDALERAFGITCVIRPTDVSKPEDVQSFVSDAHKAFGRIDLLVNNAGVYGAIGELTACAVDEWRTAIEINLMGTVYATRAVLQIMQAQRSGKIVNLAGGGVGGPFVAPRISAYATSKAAVVQFTEVIAREAAEFNVQVNAISPGFVVTQGNAVVIEAGEAKAGSEFYRRTLKERASGPTRAEEAARLIVWLASDESGLLTGKLLSAKWDDPAKLDVAGANASSLYTLRRIDNALFHEVKKR
jgi:3-oxoacyl-[acyl-carrier protein] reductase